MEPFDPENDLIDKYLRGELHGKQLDAFQRKLENDPLLKKDIEFKRLLVKGIQDKGAVQLKNYLRSRTTQKRVMLISYKTWYYAAAAVAVLLISSTALLWFSQRNAANISGIAKNTEQTEPAKSATGNAEVHKEEENPPAPPIDNQEEQLSDRAPIRENDLASGTGEIEKPILDESAKDVQSYPDVVMVASNIRIVPIRIQSSIQARTQEDADAVKSAPMAVATRRKTEKKDAAANSSPDTVSFAADMEFAEKKKIEDHMADFELSFANTRDAKQQIQVTRDPVKNENEVMVYNLPYDNPIILHYQNRYFLKTGQKYYEIDVNQTAKQSVTAVTDSTILAELNK